MPHWVLGCQGGWRVPILIVTWGGYAFYFAYQAEKQKKHGMEAFSLIVPTATFMTVLTFIVIRVLSFDGC